MDKIIGKPSKIRAGGTFSLHDETLRFAAVIHDCGGRDLGLKGRGLASPHPKSVDSKPY
jgi:hypothetical protein